MKMRTKLDIREIRGYRENLNIHENLEIGAHLKRKSDNNHSNAQYPLIILGERTS